MQREENVSRIAPFEGQNFNLLRLIAVSFGKVAEQIDRRCAAQGTKVLLQARLGFSKHLDVILKPERLPEGQCLCTASEKDGVFGVEVCLLKFANFVLAKRSR